MVIESTIELKENEVKLINDGKLLFLNVHGSDNLVMKTCSTEPTNNYDALNPGTIMVGYECEIPANTKQSFEVVMDPETIEIQGNFLNKPLEEWN